MSKANPAGISQTVFIGGLVFAIVTSSLLSTLVATQWGIAQGPKGDKGDTGPQGEQGPQGPADVFTVENLSGWLSAPAYDSGWVLSDGEWVTLNHNLGTTEVLVHLIGNDVDEEYGKSINHYGYGMYVMWQNLNTTHIEVYVDGYAQYARVQLWKISEP